MIKEKIGLLALLLFGFSVTTLLAVIRIIEGAKAGLSLISVAVLLPLIFWIIFRYNNKVLDNLKFWLRRTPRKKGALVFSVFFWYIGVISIIAYTLYDSLVLNFAIIGVLGALLGSSTYIVLLKKL